MDEVFTEVKGVLKKGGKLILLNMTEGERFGNKLYDFLYKILPKVLDGFWGIKLPDKLKQHEFKIDTRAYRQQMLFPSAVMLAYK